MRKKKIIIRVHKALEYEIFPPFLPRKGEELVYNDVLYEVTNVRHFEKVVLLFVGIISEYPHHGNKET